MNVSSSDAGKKPQRASVAYSAPAQWPLLRTNRSRPGAWRVLRVDGEHGAEQRDEDVGDREVAADVPELRAVDHRDDRRRTSAAISSSADDDCLLVGISERAPQLRVLIRGARIGY